MSLFTKLIAAFVPLAPWKLAKLVKYLSLLQKREVDTITNRQAYFFHPDFQYHIGGDSRISGTYDWPLYRDKVILGEVVTPATIIDIHANKSSLCLTTQLTGQREGRHLDTPVIFVFHFKGNKIIEGRSVPLDQNAWREFWA